MLKYIIFNITKKGVCMKTSELTKVLTKNGCYCIEHGKEHDKWYSPMTEKYFMLPRHQAKEIPKGTVNRIMKDAGLK
jgi:predicted RNA binding protein YcfA (HicA-like mRNA interferase family)